MQACGADDEELRTASTLYCCHEALVLDYERALTRIDVARRAPYDAVRALRLGRRPDPGPVGGAHVDFVVPDRATRSG